MSAPQTVADVQHTPGPWAVGGQHKRAAVYAGNTQVAFAREEYDRINSTVAEANACLMAAAPALKDALEDMLSGWRYIREQHGDLYGVGWDRCEDAARAALRAAATSARQGETA